MAANIDPIYARTPDVQVGGATLGSTAVTALDGSGALVLIFTADAVEGGWVDMISLKPVSATAATVARIFFCTATGAFTSGTTNTVANTALITELALPVITLSQVAAQSDLQIPIKRALPAGTKLLISFGTSTGVATTGYSVATFAGKY